MPAVQMIARIVSAVRMPRMNGSAGSLAPDPRDTAMPPRLADSTEVDTARLIAWPVKRIVERIAANS